MSEEHNIYILLITRHTNTHPKLDPKFRLHRYSRCTFKYIKIHNNMLLYRYATIVSTSSSFNSLIRKDETQWFKVYRKPTRSTAIQTS